MSRLPKLAARNVGRNRRRSAITGLAIFTCVALVIIMRGFVDGSAALMVADVVEGRAGALQVHQKGFVDSIEAVPTRLNIPYTPELIAKMKAVKGVTGVTGRIQFNGLVGNGVTQTMFIGRGIDVAHEKEACPRADLNIKPGGTPLGSDDKAQVVLGYELAESFGSQVGSSINIQGTSPSGRVNAIDVKVEGMSASSFPFENKRVLSVPLAAAQDLLGLNGRVTEYALAVDNLEHIETIRTELQNALGPEYEVHTWQEMQTFVRDIINRQKIVLGAIAAVLFIIALFVIANTMLMSVYERVREIGTLLALGVRRRQVLMLFMLEAGLLGLIGAVCGAVFGRLVCAYFSYRGIPLEMPGTSSLALLKPIVSMLYVSICVAVSALGAVLASALPAWRASRLNPVDALRNA